jgi:hypothetical protein
MMNLPAWPSRVFIAILLLPALGAVLSLGPAAAQVRRPQQRAALPAPGLGYNALVTEDGRVLPLYPVHDSQAKTTGVAFELQSGTLTARDTRGVLWSRPVGQAELFGGFDFNGDGWPDLGLVRSRDTGEKCGDSPVHVTWLDFVDGRTGEVLPQVTPPLKARCWDFRTATDRDPKKVYPTDQWTGQTVLFGTGVRTVASLPYYAQEGYFLTYRGQDQGFSKERFIYPSTAAFDQAYPGRAAPNAWGYPRRYEANAHVANGLILDAPGGRRLVCFTTGRVLQYAVAPLGPTQLLADRPFLSGGHKELSGRNYGLVMADPGSTSVVLVAGTDAHTVLADLLAGKMVTDPMGGIERHVAVYDYRTNRVQDRYYSNAYQGPAAHYENRVVFPCHCLLGVSAGSASRLAYNVYSNKGRWNFHVCRPGSTADATVFKDLFVWDVRDLDGDGVPEVVASPTRYESEPDVQGYYYPKWETWVLSWDEARGTLSRRKKYDGVLPYLVPAFREGSCTSSQGYLYPVLTTVRHDRLQLVCTDPRQAIVAVDY